MYMRTTFLFAAIIVATTTWGLVYLKKQKSKANYQLLAVNQNAVNNNALKNVSINPANIKKYVQKNGFNTTHYFFINMALPSGSNRFFVYNLKTDSVVAAGLVCHGSGTTSTDSIVFSNQPNSLCTSLGKYKIGAAYQGKFGLAFKLHGLEASNSNALARAVVLHSHGCVPAAPVYPNTICQSWGCPTVAPSFLQTLQGYINKSKQPTLLVIAK
jgi:hypothetical protein